MQYYNTKNSKGLFIFMILLLTCVTFSCHKKITTKIINENNYINNDSIIYELPKKATEKILDCISDQEISYAI